MGCSLDFLEIQLKIWALLIGPVENLAIVTSVCTPSRKLSACIYMVKIFMGYFSELLL